MFCEYKDLFGKPGEGFHQSRLFGLAANDLLGTIAFIIIFSLTTGYNLLVVALLTFLLGIVMHRLFCVDTTIDRTIFGSPESSDTYKKWKNSQSNERKQTTLVSSIRI